MSGQQPAALYNLKAAGFRPNAAPRCRLLGAVPAGVSSAPAALGGGWTADGPAMGPGSRWALLMGPGPCWALLAPLLAPLLRCAAGRVSAGSPAGSCPPGPGGFCGACKAGAHLVS